MKSIDDLKKFIEITKEPFFCDQDTITSEVFDLLKTIKDASLIRCLFSREKKNESGRHPHFNVEFVCPNCGKKVTESLVSKTHLIDEMLLGEKHCVEYNGWSLGFRKGEYWCKDCIEQLAETKYLEEREQEARLEEIQKMKEELRDAELSREKNFDRLILQKWFGTADLDNNEHTYQELVNDFHNLEKKEYYKELFSEEYAKVSDFNRTIYYTLCESEAAKIKKPKCEISGLDENMAFVFYGKLESAYKSPMSFHWISQNILSEYGENYVKDYFDKHNNTTNDTDIHGIHEICRFGKRHRGLEFEDILTRDRSYLVWYKQNVKPGFNIVDTEGHLLL